MQKWSIRTRLAGVQVLLLAASIGALTLLSWRFGERLVQDGIEDRTTALTRAVTKAVALPLSAGDRDGLSRQVAVLAADPDVLSIEVRDARGNLAASAGDSPGVLARGSDAATDAGPSSSWQAGAGGPSYQCVHPVYLRAGERPSDRVGSVRIVVSSSRSAPTLRRLRRTTLGVAVALLAAALTVAHFTGRELTIPLERLTAAAEEVSRGTLDAEVPSAGPGEIGRLAKAFGAMTRALQEQSARLREVTERELARARTDWDATFNAITDMIVVNDLEGQVVRANRAFRDWAAAHRVEGAWLRGLLTPRPADASGGDGVAPEPALRQTAFGGTHLSVSTFPIRGEAGVLVGQVVVLHDVTERDRLRDQLAQSEKMSALGMLISGVAHEINNPLSGIIGFAELSLRQPVPDGVRSKLAKIRDLGDRVARLVRNLLTFARPHAAERGSVDLNALVRQTLDLRAYDHSVSHIAVDAELDPGLPRFAGDCHQLQQVLMNLVINAEQAMKAHGRGGRLRVATRTAGDTVELSVEDSGPGIPADVLPCIFDPFFTTKPVGQGTGLGLSLVHGIVRDHGGTIAAENRAEGGACFRVLLPRAEVLARPEAPALAQAPSGAGRRVMLVDDEPAVLEFAREAVAAAGYAVTAAATVDAAWELLQTTTPDLVLADMRMPSKDGRDLAALVDGLPAPLRSRLCFMTGDVANPDTRRFTEARGASVLAKPFSVEELVAFVGRQVEAASARPDASGKGGTA